MEDCVSERDWFRMLRSSDTRCTKDMVGCWLARCEPDERGETTLKVRLGVVRDRDPDAPRWDSGRQVKWGLRGRPMWEGKRMLELLTDERSQLYMCFTGYGRARAFAPAGTL